MKLLNYIDLKKLSIFDKVFVKLFIYFFFIYRIVYRKKSERLTDEKNNYSSLLSKQ